MTCATRSTLSTLLLVAASYGCDLAPPDEIEEGPASDMEVTPAALKLKPVQLLEAGTTTQNVLGVYAWEVSVDKDESMFLGLSKNGRRVLTVRTSRRDPDKNVGRVTFQGQPKALKFSFDKRTNRLTVSDNRALKLIDVINAHSRDQAAGNVLKKYDNDTMVQVATCALCTYGALSCAGNILGCTAAGAVTSGAALLACAANLAGSCGTALAACYICVSQTSSSPNVHVQVEGESQDISSICMRKDPCWCEMHPNECFTPAES